MAEQPGDRGRDWFAIEVTSAFVDPNTVTPFEGVNIIGGLGGFDGSVPLPTGMSIELGPAPELPITVSGGIVPDSSQMVQAGPGYLSEQHDAEIELVAPRVQLSELHSFEVGLHLHLEETHEVALELSNLQQIIKRDDEEFMLLF